MTFEGSVLCFLGVAGTAEQRAVRGCHFSSCSSQLMYTLSINVLQYLYTYSTPQQRRCDNLYFLFLHYHLLWPHDEQWNLVGKPNMWKFDKSQNFRLIQLLYWYLVIIISTLWIQFCTYSGVYLSIYISCHFILLHHYVTGKIEKIAIVLFACNCWF